LLAHAERDRGNLADARKHIEDAISRVSAMRADLDSRTFRTSYFAREQSGYEFYIDLLMRMHNRSPSEGHDQAALAISEQARARSLLEMLSEARIDIRQGVDPTLLARERELSQQINAKAARLIQALGQQNAKEQAASLNKEISELEDQYQRVRAAIRKASPQYAALTEPQPLNSKEIQQLLDEETLLLQYSVGDHRSYLWVVARDSIKSYELPKREVIKKAARQVYDLLTARSLRIKEETAAERRQRIARADEQLLQAAAQLSEIVIGPAAAELRGKRLVVVPDGELHYIPFAVLPAPLANQASAAQEKTNNKIQTSNQSYRPLIASHEIVSLPSASAFAEHRKSLAGRKPAGRAIAVIADPVFSSADERLKAPRDNSAGEKSGQADSTATTRILEHTAENKIAIARLPFTGREAEEILSIVPSSSNFKALGFNATRAAASSPELAKYRYVHFATHGHLNTENPDSSGIVLSLIDERGQPQPGMLLARELYNLKLPAELVVLSACETGLGKEFRGEGLWGLTRGFMYAGAARVVVSLWSVNDRATSELMARFYKAMLKDKQTPAAALRTAQVEMWRQKQWQSPYYWAAFTLQGEWR
jgi:CHAT domain-containing protein